MCSQTEESIGAVETILQNYYEEDAQEEEDDAENRKNRENSENSEISDNGDNSGNRKINIKNENTKNIDTNMHKEEKASKTKRQIPIIVCLNKMDSKMFLNTDLNTR